MSVPQQSHGTSVVKKSFDIIKMNNHDSEKPGGPDPLVLIFDPV